MHTIFQGMARSSSAKSADTLSDSIAVRPRACFANSPIAPLAARLMRSLTTENGSSQPPCSQVPSHRHELATDARRSDSTHPAVRETAQNPLTRRSNLGIPPRRLSTTTQTTNFIAITPAPTTATLLALSLAAIETRPGRTTNQSGPPLRSGRASRAPPHGESITTTAATNIRPRDLATLGGLARRRPKDDERARKADLLGLLTKEAGGSIAHRRRSKRR